MPFVTKLRLQSGDRGVLESVVADIKRRAERKGVQLKGPHPKPPSEFSVPQLKGVGREGFAPWHYTVYTRTIEIVGHDGFARTVAERSYPESVHIAAEITQVRGSEG